MVKITTRQRCRPCLQLIREDNQAAGKTYTWTYDNAGNIQNRKEYSYTTETLGTVLDTIDYTYGEKVLENGWGDLLTAYDGSAITYDEVGNPLSDGTWTYTWEHGRQLASMTNGNATWYFTYDPNGMRTSRTSDSKSYSYVYNGGQLTQMSVGNDILTFTYDVCGNPQTVDHNGTIYYYVTNLQGDVVSILDAGGTTVASYSYDAWGNHLSTTGTLSATLGTLNPLRYRRYVYDHETGLYYLQSRYYNPSTSRFLNADALASTGQGELGNNMFAYCNNNPVLYTDPAGYYPLEAAFDFLNEWLFGDGEDQNFEEGSRIVEQLKQSKSMQALIDEAIENCKKGIATTSGTHEFKPGEDGYELYLSAQHVDYTIIVKKQEISFTFLSLQVKMTRYTAIVQVHDTYNFDEYRAWDSFGNTMNNLAYRYYLLGGGNDYEWYATYTYSTNWEYDISN